jgi:hypothetical protein
MRELHVSSRVVRELTMHHELACTELHPAATPPRPNYIVTVPASLMSVLLPIRKGRHEIKRVQIIFLELCWFPAVTIPKRCLVTLTMAAASSSWEPREAGFSADVRITFQERRFEDLP